MRFLAATALAALLATPALAQTQQDEPAQTDTTIHEEVPDAAAPDAAPPVEEEPVDTAPEQERVPQSAAEIDLSLLLTPDMRLLYFDPAQTYLTPYLGRSFTNAIAYHKRLFDWTPWERTTVLLKDFSDYGNAAARSSPNNAVLFDVAPLSLAFETFSPGERFFTLTNHELAHVATMDVWNKTDAGWRKFFHGKPMPIPEHPESILYNFLATPRINAPRWYLEGSAVFLETWMAGGLGRGQGAYDEMAFRAKVRDDDRFYSPLGLESAGINADFQVGVNDYLYGTRFMSYLALTYSPAKVIEWLKRGEGSAGYYSTQFKRVFGRRLDDVWDDWIRFEHEYQKVNLAELAKVPLTPTQRLAPRGLGSVSRAFYDAKTNSLIGGFRDLGVLPHVGRLSLDSGKVKHLDDIKGAMLYRVTSITFDPEARKAYYTEDNYAYREVIELDVDTGKRRMLLRDARIGDLAFNRADKSIWGIRHQNGFATLVRIPAPYAGFNQVHTFDYGQVPFDLDVSPDGTMIAAAFGEIDGKQSIRVWKTPEVVDTGDLFAALTAAAEAADSAGAGATPASAGAGAPTPEAVAEAADVAAEEEVPDGAVETPAADEPKLVEVARLTLGTALPEGFVFAPDGKSLWGSAYYTGVSNIFRFDIATQKWDAMSNASTGLFRPIPFADGSLIAWEYAGDGFVPVRIDPKPHEDLGTIRFLGNKLVEERPELKQWGVGSPASVRIEELITGRGKYDPAKERKLDSLYPIVEGYQGEVAFGYHAIFEDPLQFNQILATISYSPWSDGNAWDRLHAEIELKTLKWNFRAWHNDADFYDLFGPVERSRKGDALIIGFKDTKIYDPPRQLDIFAEVGVFLGLEQLPRQQNVQTDFKNLVAGEAGVRYTNTTRALGAVDHEKGWRWELIGTGGYARDHFYPQIHGGLDAGVPLPIKNSSVWFYSSAGIAGGRKESSLGSFYFGSFGNNYVDDREVKRYREYDSFPGFEIGEIDARKFGKLIGEWNLPPVRFEEVGTASFYLSSARTAIFAGALAVDRAFGESETYQTLGVQVDLNFTVALRLPMTFSIGAATGFRDGHYEKTEWLASLKIL